MKIKKIFFVYFLLFFLTGCSAEANLIIKTNGNIEENIQVYNSWSNLKNYYKNLEQAKENYALSYQDFFQTSKYKVSYTTKKSVLKADIYGVHNTLDTISTSDVYSTLFGQLNRNNNQYILPIQEEVLDLFEDTLGLGAENDLFFDNIILNIQFHNVVENANSDSYNSKNNTYTWIINKDNLNRDIEFTITNTKRYDIIMAYLFKKYIDFVFLGVFLLGIGLFVVYVIRKSKRENAI